MTLLCSFCVISKILHDTWTVYNKKEGMVFIYKKVISLRTLFPLESFFNLNLSGLKFFTRNVYDVILFVQYNVKNRNGILKISIIKITLIVTIKSVRTVHNQVVIISPSLKVGIRFIFIL